jgi:hypothetical protein
VASFAALFVLLALAPGNVWSDDREDKSTRILNDLGRKAFRWFQDNRNPKSGLIRDRGPNWKGRGTPSDMASIASAGYYLSLLPEAVRLGQITKPEAERDAIQLLQFVKTEMQDKHGLLFHFIHWETGKRWDQSEISVLDSAIFFNGCMVAAEALGGRVAELANYLVDRVDWGKFLTAHPKTKASVLSLGWRPESGGLIGATELRSSEMAMPCFLAVGSRSHPVGPECWYNVPVAYGLVCGHKILNPEQPLFTSYYGLGWHNLKGKVDRTGVDLEANARLAALANRAFCRQGAAKYHTYQKSDGFWWGISAGDAPTGYVAPGPVLGQIDGTVWPTAALATIPWVSDEFRDDLSRWQASRSWGRANGEYGLSPFNLDKDWVGADVIGIDLGSFAVSLANYRNETVRSLWMRHPVAVNALQKLGFKDASKIPVRAPRKLTGAAQ